MRFGNADVYSWPEADDAARVAGSLLVLHIVHRPDMAIALAGGSTPRRTHEAAVRFLSSPEPPREVVERFNAARAAGKEAALEDVRAVGRYGAAMTACRVMPRVRWFFGDERCVPPDHPESNYRMARETLFEPAGIPATAVHRMEGEREDRDAAAEAYARGLPARLDMLLLGVGEDGHVASLFPEAPALDETERRVVAACHPKTLQWRLTITPPVIAAATVVIVLATGAAKSRAVARALIDDVGPRELPARLVSQRPSFWLLDDAAASSLPQKPGPLSSEEQPR